MRASGLMDLAFFIISIYGRYWFAAPVAADAPFLTLSLWKDLHSWASRDPALSAATLRSLDRHTWYLTERNLILSLFSRIVPDEIKKSIADALLLPENEAGEIPLGKPDLPQISPESELEDFVGPETWFLFQVSKSVILYFALFENSVTHSYQFLLAIAAHKYFTNFSAKTCHRMGRGRFVPRAQRDRHRLSRGQRRSRESCKVRKRLHASLNQKRGPASVRYTNV